MRVCVPILALSLALACCSHPHAPGGTPELWHEPGNVEAFDFINGAHGPEFAPKAPFHFLREDLRGTSPKLFVTDAEGREWRVKGGGESRAETFCTRLAAALGYYGEPTWFVPNGRVDGVHDLRRAAGFIRSDGGFTWASFERFEPGLRFLQDEAWSWSGNPLDGTPQLNGLKVLIMLVSDWDNKDASNSLRESNLGILERRADGLKSWIYFVDDWGQSLGRWGESYSGTSIFDCDGFSAQSKSFVLGTSGGVVQFGYRGQHTKDFVSGIRPSDVAWLMRYLGRVRDEQLRAGLLASGASEEQATCLADALRDRIGQLKKAAQ